MHWLTALAWGFVGGWWLCYFIIAMPYKRLLDRTLASNRRLLSIADDLLIKLNTALDMVDRDQGDEWKDSQDER